MSYNHEYRVWSEQGPMCPNPRKHWEMTQVLRKEYSEVTNLDVIKFASILSQNNQPLFTLYALIFLFELGILGLLINNLR